LGFERRPGAQWCRGAVPPQRFAPAGAASTAKKSRHAADSATAMVCPDPQTRVRPLSVTARIHRQQSRHLELSCRLIDEMAMATVDAMLTSL
jgi:hypothetical protein